MKPDYKVLMIVDKDNYDSVCSSIIPSLIFNNLKIIGISNKNDKEKLLKEVNNASFDYDKCILSGISIDNNIADILEKKFNGRVFAIVSKIEDYYLCNEYFWMKPQTIWLDKNKASLTSDVYYMLLNELNFKNHFAFQSFVNQLDKEINYEIINNNIYLEDLFNSLNNQSKFINLVHNRLKFNVIRGQEFKMNKKDSELVLEDLKMVKEYTNI